MVRHWNRLLRTETDPTGPAADAPRPVDQRLRRDHDRRRAAHRARHEVPAGRVDRDRGHGGVLRADAGHPAALRPGRRRAGDRRGSTPCCPSRNHAIVLVSTLHKPTLRALAYARATRPDVLEALTVNVDDADTRSGSCASGRSAAHPGAAEGDRVAVPGDHPAGAGVRQAGADRNPRDVVTVFIPEYVVGHWWEQLLHNQSALRLKGRLLFQPGVMVTSVPWQLRVLGADATTRRPGDAARLVAPRLRGRRPAGRSAPRRRSRERRW